MGLVYLPTFFIPNVGKYTVRPMGILCFPMLSSPSPSPAGIPGLSPCVNDRNGNGGEGRERLFRRGVGRQQLGGGTESARIRKVRSLGF